MKKTKRRSNKEINEDTERRFLNKTASEIYQTFYEKTEYPMFAWAALHFYAELGYPIPDWVMLYLKDTALKVLSADKPSLKLFGKFTEQGTNACKQYRSWVRKFYYYASQFQNDLVNSVSIPNVVP